jgi:hypothetical protein
MKYSANCIHYKIHPFLAENHTKKPNICQVTKWLAFLVHFLLKLFIFKLTISHVTHARTWLHNFSCTLLISNSMVSCGIWKNTHSWVFQRLQMALVVRTRAILIIFEKLTRACFSQIPLETILLYTYTNLFWKVVLKLMFFWLVQFW